MGRFGERRWRGRTSAQRRVKALASGAREGVGSPTRRAVLVRTQGYASRATTSMSSCGGCSWLSAIGAIAPIVCASVAFAACGGEQAADVSDQRARAPSDLRQVRKLQFGEEAFDQRPASCATTHGVLIVDGKPKPGKLRIGSGACVLWGNTSDRAVHVVSKQPYPEGGSMTRSHELPPRSAGLYGPLERLTPQRAALDERRRKERTSCPYQAVGLGDPSTTAPVEHSYTITPGGARGTLIVDPAQADSPTQQQRPLGADLRALQRLRCGDVLLEERASSCEVTKAVLIAGGQPRPRNLKLKLKAGRAVCLFWGNQGDAAVVAQLRSERSRTRPAADRDKRVVDRRPFRHRIVCRSDFDLEDAGGHLEIRRRGQPKCTRKPASARPQTAKVNIPPQTAAPLAGFSVEEGAGAEPPTQGPSYTIKPGGAVTTITFE